MKLTSFQQACLLAVVLWSTVLVTFITNAWIALIYWSFIIPLFGVFIALTTNDSGRNGDVRRGRNV